MSRDRKMPKDPADPRRLHDPGRGLRSHVEAAGVPVQPPRPDPAAEAAQGESGPCVVCHLPYWEHVEGVIPKVAALTGVEPHEFQPVPALDADAMIKPGLLVNEREASVLREQGFSERNFIISPSVPAGRMLVKPTLKEFEPTLHEAVHEAERDARAAGRPWPPKATVTIEPEYDADGVHRDDVYPEITRALLRQQGNAHPPTNIQSELARARGRMEGVAAQALQNMRGSHFEVVPTDPEVPRPPRDVAEAIRWIESWRDHRLGEANGVKHRAGTGPAYRAEGEQAAFAQVLNLLQYGNPEGDR